ncbi:hypothetical protein [Caballeronia sp. dw_19]|uniref:hypothetical protein n=1 Tax=Caballeronia sp. dw_19 TaxID=2719791 RepID=UPI001BD33D1A|nr:hypothetical protein [Caballeronia sp. dw_19]
MAKQAMQIETPLIKRPLEEILAAARAAGRQAFTQRETLDSAWQDAAFVWIDKTLPDNQGMPDEYVNSLLQKAKSAFEQGVEEYLDGVSQVVQAPTPRLPGVGYWFSEDDSFAFGLMVDLLKFQVERFDPDALFDRFYARLVSEYDRRAPHVEAARAYGIAVRSVGQEDEPLSMSMLIEETLFLQIVPIAIDRATLVERLPPMLREFVGLLADDAAVGSDPFPNAI